MSVVVITPPEPLIMLSVVKAHLRVDHDDDDVLIAAYLAAATALIDGPAGWLGRSLGPQTLELRADEFACWSTAPVALPYGPVIDIVSISYVDAAGTEQVLAPTDVTRAADGIRPLYGESWPSVRLYAETVRIRYRAGYTADPDADPIVAAVPAPIIAAILLHTGDLYAFRETAVVGAISASIDMSTAVQSLLGPYRVWDI